MRPYRLIVLVAFTAGLAGCDLFTADIEEPSVCQTFPNQTFPGIPPVPVFPLTLHLPLTQQLDELPANNDDATKTEARVITVDLTAKTGTNDLNFIDQVKITILPPTGTALPPKPVIDYRRVGAAGRTIHLVPTDTSGNLLDYLKGKQLKLDTELSVSSLPPGNWTVDIKACVWLKVSVKYFKVKSTPGT